VETAKHKDESVEAGRRYVEAYVTYVHYIEGLHNTIAGGAASHGEVKRPEAAPALTIGADMSPEAWNARMLSRDRERMCRTMN